MTQFLKSKAIEIFIIFVLLVALVASAIYPTYIGDIWNMAAIIIGPALGVLFVNQHDREARLRQRQLEALHSIICYGENYRSPDTDAALRLIPVYYQGQKEVICQLNKYIEARNCINKFLEKYPNGPFEELWVNKLRKLHSALNQLILEMSKSLGTSLNAAEFQKNWKTIVPLDTLSPAFKEQSDEAIIRQGLKGVLQDNKAINVYIVNKPEGDDRG